MHRLENLELIYEEITKTCQRGQNYWIPSVWLPQSNSSCKLIKINMFDFFSKQIDFVLSFKAKEKPRIREIKPIVYNLFPRYTTAFDHNLDGEISIESIDGVFYETGTLLKSIALLPYLISLGVDIIYLLPVFEIGIDGRRGNLGSPYAIKNHFKFDPRLSEPFLEVPLQTQFKAFVEACHHLGIKVILEFVLRSVSLDCDLVFDHPEWFYWVYDERCKDILLPPDFTKEELVLIQQKVKSKDFESLPAPNKSYQGLFASPPQMVYKVGDKVFGKTENGSVVRIPNAFADWPPDDKQPIWSDVTYLKYFDSPEFNYIAYNTIRMYDKKLNRKEFYNLSLWNYLIGVIPHYIHHYNIDGAMIDMGHAMPKELLDEVISKAKKSKEGFILWEENFQVANQSKENGYDAVVGYLFFDQHNQNKVRELIIRMEKKEFPIPFFLTGETHNTSRTARFGCSFNRLIWTFNSFLNGLRFILTGFELCEVIPVNTGLGFSEDEIKKLPPERLPLFSSLSLDWVSFFIGDTIRQINELHDNVFAFINYNIKSFEDLPSIRLVITNALDIVGYEVQIDEMRTIIVLGNFSRENRAFSFSNSTLRYKVVQKLFPSSIPIDPSKQILFDGYECKVFLGINS
ncbi:MAG: alpha-amylase family glycosyl hydrolase [Candidatus Kapaibacteriales bacterium]